MSDDILLFSDEIPPSGGGTGVIAKKLLDNYVAMGKHVTLLSGDEANYNGNNVHHVPVKRSRIIWVFNYFLAIMLKLSVSKFKQIIINDQMSAYLSGLFFSKAQLAKSTVIIHGRDANFFFNRTSNKHKFFLFKPFYKRAIKHCKRIVAVSAWTQEEYLKKIPLDILPLIEEKVSWHFAGVDKADLMGGHRPDWLDASELQSKRILLSVGRLVPRKGYADMLEVLHQNVNTCPDLLWLIVGDGPLASQLKEKVELLGLQEHVRFIGKVPRNTLSHIYEFADVFWLLSPIEPFGLVYLEASNFNLPSLAPAKGGAKEAVVDGVNGFHVSKEIDFKSIFKQTESIRREFLPEKHAKEITTMAFSKFVVEP